MKSTLEFLNPKKLVRLEGLYQGKNVYVKNPYKSLLQPTIEQVVVNDNTIQQKSTINPLEVDLKSLNLKVGRRYFITVEYDALDVKSSVSILEV